MPYINKGNTTTFAELPANPTSKGNRHDHLSSGYPNSPIGSATAEYTVGVNDANSEYTMYKSLLSNQIQGAAGGALEFTRDYWGFDDNEEVSLDYNAPTLYPPNENIHHAFVPNLRPPSRTELDNDKGENIQSGLSPNFIEEGRRLPLQPSDTSDRVASGNDLDRSDKPSKANVDSAGTILFDAAVIPAVVE